MKKENILFEVQRIRELMSVNEISKIEESFLNEQAFGKFLSKVFSNGAEIAGKVGPQAMRQASSELDDLIRLNSSLPARIANETGPTYIKRIAKSDISEDLLKQVYSLYTKHVPDLGSAVLSSVKNSIISDAPLLTKMAKVHGNDEDLIKYLEEMGFQRGSTEMDEIVSKVSNVRKTIPVDVKVTLPSKWYDMKRLEITAENVKQQTADTLKQAFSRTSLSQMFKDVNYDEGIQNFANRIIKEIESRGFRSTAEAEEFIIKEAEKVQKNVIEKLKTSDGTFQKYLKKYGPKLTFPPNATFMQKWMVLSTYWAVISTIYNVFNFKKDIQLCVVNMAKKNGKDINTVGKQEKDGYYDTCIKKIGATDFASTAISLLPYGMAASIGYLVMKDSDVDVPDVVNRNEPIVDIYDNSPEGFKKYYIAIADPGYPWIDDDFKFLKRDGDKYTFSAAEDGKELPARTWEFKNGKFEEIK